MENQLVVRRPIRSSRISQRFGENKACIAVGGKITAVGKTGCAHGTKPFYQSIGLKAHNGHDIPAIVGEPVVHGGTFDGWMKTEVDSSGGIGVDVVSNEPLFFKGAVPVGLEAVKTTADGFYSYVKIRYWHLQASVGHDGKPVTFGQQIGLAGNTGASSAPHLHWAPKWCDKDGRGIFEWNGYQGAFDPEGKYCTYTHSIYAGDSVKHLALPVAQLTPAERTHITSQLSLLTRLLLALRELTYKI